MTIETYDKLPGRKKKAPGKTIYDWVGLAVAAANNPGKWARMAVPYRGYARYVTDGSIAAFKDYDGTFRTATRQEGDSIYLYVQYEPAP